MKQTNLLEDEPNYAELLRALIGASEDLLPFAIVCCGDPLRAEAYVQDVLLLSLENGWLCRSVDENERITHNEFKEDILRLLWERVHKDSLKGIIAGVRTYGERSTGFYRLNLLERATLFLRMRLQLTYPEIASVLQEDSEDVLVARVHQARERLLGRPLAQGIGVLDDES